MLCPAEAKHQVQQAISAAGKGGGFILADNYGEIPWEVSKDVLLAIRDAVERHGHYPLPNSSTRAKEGGMELLSEPITTVAICGNFYPEAAALCAQGELPGIDLVGRTASCERPIKSWSELAQQLPELNPAQPLLVIGTCLPSALPDPPADVHTLCLHNLDQCFNLIAGKTLTDKLIRC